MFVRKSFTVKAPGHYHLGTSFTIVTKLMAQATVSVLQAEVCAPYRWRCTTTTRPGITTSSGSSPPPSRRWVTERDFKSSPGRQMGRWADGQAYQLTEIVPNDTVT